ncbi:large conductance mechanosensitive channel protein MscL [uncultured Neglectibacter sp.]|uniref:large conductance mechanosensitive channel protein MscL n=1 Tax=uncultured Neglectibacter sp. TaxID=1924108 RepID=UPI0034DFAC6E
MKKITKEFQEFISRGNVVDMAVGVIIGGAFTAIVNSLVNDMLTPLLGLLTGGMDFSTLSFGIGDAQFCYGSFIAAVINFLLIALVLFLLVKGINKLRRKPEEKPAEPTTKACPFCKTEIDLHATRCPHCTSQLEE